MKPRTAIILATVLAIVFGAVAVNMWVRSWDKKGADKTKESKAKDRKIFSKASSGAKRLVVSPRGGPELVFEYVNRKWRLSKPISARADAGRIAGIKDGVKLLSNVAGGDLLMTDHCMLTSSGWFTTNHPGDPEGEWIGGDRDGGQAPEGMMHLYAGGGAKWVDFENASISPRYYDNYTFAEWPAEATWLD